jgi:hypothetical protein
MSSAQEIVMAAAGASGAALYVEDVFSTYTYIGNGSSQSISNSINLLGKGGLVWVKSRTSTTFNNFVADTVRGAGKILTTNENAASSNPGGLISAFNSDGFSVNVTGGTGTNSSGMKFVSWALRKEQKFFDIVTYTGNGANRTIAHNLGSVPGCIIVKRTDAPGAWPVYHRGLANTEYLVLNTTAIKATGATYWNSTTPTSTVFSVGTAADVNANGGTYVAYLFAHDAGGFGASGTDNIISCGSYVGNLTANQAISVGYEPQWVLIKRATAGSSNWFIYDNIRPAGVTNAASLSPNLTASETTNDLVSFNSTGFLINQANSAVNGNGDTFVYIAIRRPMKTPTSATSVFSLSSVTPASPVTVTTNFPVDMSLSTTQSISEERYLVDRSSGTVENEGLWLQTNSNVTQSGQAYGQDFSSMTNLKDLIWNDYVGTASSVIFWNFKRAPGFFDMVPYVGTGASRTVTHNLGVTPELLIVKRRTVATADWYVWQTSFTAQDYIFLNSDAAKATSAGAGIWNSTLPTSSVFSLGNNGALNASGSRFTAYLFATLAGISKVGSYTGNGTSQTINCGFSAGSRFVMVKRTDNTGNWTVFDSVRGIVAGNDPALYLNNTLAQVTSADAVDTDNSGFVVNQETTLNLNVNAASYIFLAIA